MRVLVGADHAGRTLKDALIASQVFAPHAYEDLTPHTTGPIDYPDVAVAAARRIARGDADRAVLICGTGIGMAIAASGVPHARAFVCSDPYSAEMARQHNDANIVCLGERVLGLGLAQAIVQCFLVTSFAGGRHRARLDRIEELIAKANL